VLAPEPRALSSPAKRAPELHLRRGHPAPQGPGPADCAGKCVHNGNISVVVWLSKCGVCWRSPPPPPSAVPLPRWGRMGAGPPPQGEVAAKRTEGGSDAAT
jgi:hypothetical protein